jgi:hypothetical protein
VLATVRYDALLCLLASELQKTYCAVSTRLGSRSLLLLLPLLLLLLLLLLQFVAVKHHWYWQFNFIFQRLEVAKPDDWHGYALYIEEDNYAAPDLLAVLGQMSDIAQNQCGPDKCGILNLGLKTQEAVSDSGAGFDRRGHVRAHRCGYPSCLPECQLSVVLRVLPFTCIKTSHLT